MLICITPPWHIRISEWENPYFVWYSAVAPEQAQDLIGSKLDQDPFLEFFVHDVSTSTRLIV